MPILIPNRDKKSGKLTQWLPLQQETEDLITNNPYIAEALHQKLFKIYHNAQAVGIMKGMLQMAQRMQQAGYQMDFIMQITGLSE